LLASRSSMAGNRKKLRSVLITGRSLCPASDPQNKTIFSEMACFPEAMS
jgi:hypothetical protein